MVVLSVWRREHETFWRHGEWSTCFLHLFCTHLQRVRKDLSVVRETVLERETCRRILLERGGDHHHPPLRSDGLGNAQTYKAHLEARLSTRNTKITDITNLLVCRVCELCGDTKAAERGVYVGDDSEANMYRAMISKFKEKANV